MGPKKYKSLKKLIKEEIKLLTEQTYVFPCTPENDWCNPAPPNICAYLPCEEDTYSPNPGFNLNFSGYVPWAPTGYSGPNYTIGYHDNYNDGVTPYAEQEGIWGTGIPGPSPITNPDGTAQWGNLPNLSIDCSNPHNGSTMLDT